MSLTETDLFGNTRDKVATAIERIKTFCPEEGYYVAFSGGKDSVVILDLVKKSGVKFDAHYNLTTVDPPELVKFIKTFPEVERHHPKKNMWKLIVHKGFPPTRVVRYCCQELKEGGGDGRRIITGVRWAESSRRANRRKMVEPDFRNGRKFIVNPIIDWSDDDVWDYIKEYNVRYCSLYDEGYKRLGCIGCPLAGHKSMLKEFERWPTFKNAYIRAFDMAIKNKPPQNGHSKTGQEMFDWWIMDTKNMPDPNQCDFGFYDD